VDAAVAEQLKAAGFNWLAVGIEPGDGRVRADDPVMPTQQQSARLAPWIGGGVPDHPANLCARDRNHHIIERKP